MLRFAAFCVYLAAWVVLAIAAVVGAIPRLQRVASGSTRITVPDLVGMLLQGCAALATTLSMKPGPLRPGTLALAGALVLSPLAAGLFVWALRSAPENRSGDARDRWRVCVAAASDLFGFSGDADRDRIAGFGRV